MTKRYPHDCTNCVPLGEYGQYDLYFCDQEPTVIARYGKDGDYVSGLCFAGSIPELTEAKKRAIEAGLLPNE